MGPVLQYQRAPSEEQAAPGGAAPSGAGSEASLPSNGEEPPRIRRYASSNLGSEELSAFGGVEDLPTEGPDLSGSVESAGDDTFTPRRTSFSPEQTAEPSASFFTGGGWND